MIIDGLRIAQEIRAELSAKIAAASQKPKLRVILVGANPASLSYVGRKEKACAEVGMEYECLRFDESVSETELLSAIAETNADDAVHGLIVQLPLPAHVDKRKVVSAIDPKKDVDGFTESNAGKCFLGSDDGLLPCTPKGVMRLIAETGTDVSGKDVTVVGYGDIVGKPLSIMLANAGATVTACHSKTRDLAAHTKNADVVVVAAGVPNLLKASMVKPGAVVIDVGINRVDGKLRGDAEFEGIEKIAAVTPVPGGVGPMTVAMLLENTFVAWERSRKR